MHTNPLDTIYALATPYGRSGVAVIRASGPAAREGLARLTKKSPPAPRQAGLRTLVDFVSRETIDEAMVITFVAPASFTGEDVVEYHLHGGPAVIDSALAALAHCDGHRPAAPGEFTRRAFENNKLDLTAAEAIADLIDAETQAQKLQALDQLGGGLKALYDGWREKLKTSLAYAEAEIDFADEDLPDNLATAVYPGLRTLMSEIAAHLDDNRRGERLRDGIRVAVIGAPNAGKSSLVNALAARDVAIVSEHAGTTRDVIDVHLDIGGLPVILSDTAGLRPDQLGDSAQDSIESEGIRRALACAENADLRVLLFDATCWPALDPHTTALIDGHSIVALNKAETLSPAQATGIDVAGQTPLLISAATGAGLDSLIAALRDKTAALIGTRETPSLTRQRHRHALEDCRAALARALDGTMPELIAEDIRVAMQALGRITGRVDVEDLLDVIFRDFCIGK